MSGKLIGAWALDSTLVIVGLKGGDSGNATLAVCLDLDRGNVTTGEEWAALVRGDRVDQLLEQTGATLVRVDTWDGSRFGDGTGGTVERVDGEVTGSGLNRPALPTIRISGSELAEIAAQDIADQADASVKLLLELGWTGPGSAYDLVNFHGDVEGLAERLGYEPNREQRHELERLIRAKLDETK